MELGVNLNIVSKQCRLFRSAARFAVSYCIMRLIEFPENPQHVQAYFNILNNINLLTTKRNLLYIRHQSVPHCKHFPLSYKNQSVDDV
jgi:hypothetical protein